MRRKTIKCLALAVALSLLAISAAAETVWGDLNARYANLSKLQYNGEEYRLNRRVTSILIAGTDHRSDVQNSEYEYRNGGQADFLLLLAIDDNAKAVKSLQIDRDTLAELTVLNVLGEVSGSRNAQICLAHSFGDGGRQSCELLVSAVSNLLKGTPIDHYFVMNLDGIAAFNSAIGGVQVSLQDDLSAYDPEMTPGKTMVLTGDQAEIFVRQRYSIGEQTNAARQVRQRAYMQAASDVILEKVMQNTSFITDLFDKVEPYATTDMTHGRILNYTKAAMDYQFLPLQTLPGSHSVNSAGFMEFVPDEDALLKYTIETFYLPMK